jgi:hypothetical protein
MTRSPVLLAGRHGRWSLPWALAGTALVAVLFVTFVFGASWGEARIAQTFGREPTSDQALRPGRIEDFIGFALFGLALVAAAALTLLTVHGQDPRRAVAADRRFDWRLFATTAAAYFIVIVAGQVLDFTIDPASYALIPRTWSHLPWLLLGAAVILPQAFGEDYLFKGYLTRVWGAVFPFRLLLIPAIALVFTSGHLYNSDMKTDLTFNVIGFIASEIIALLIFVRTGSVAATTGYHWMNNVNVFCLVSTSPGQSDALSLIRSTDMIVLAGKSHFYDPMSWIGLISGLGLFAALVFWQRSPFYLRPVDDEQRTAIDHRA